MSRTHNAGIVTAYGSAVRGGYTGTYEQFCAQQAQYAENARQMEQAVSDVRQIKTSVESAVSEAETYAANAGQSETNASNSAMQASESASNASQSANNASNSADSASQSASSAQTSASNASTSEQNAQQYAEDAQDILESVQTEGDTQVSRVQAKGDEVIELIPEDYTQMQTDIQNMSTDIQNMSVEIYNNEIDILKAFPTDIVSGDVALFNDGADDIPVKNLTVDIEPVQDFHGYDKPWGAGSGKNLLDPSLLKDQVAWNVIKIYAAEGTMLTMSTNCPANTGLAVYFRQPDGTQGEGNAVVSAVSSKAITLTVSDSGYVEVVQRRAAGDKSFSEYNWQIEKGSEATDYEPYENVCHISGWNEMNLTCNNEIINIDWTDEAGIVYGGTLNVTTGVLTKTHVFSELSVSGWSNSGANFWRNQPGMSLTNPAKIGYCSHYPCATEISGNKVIIFGKSRFSTVSTIVIRDNNFATASDLEAYLSAQKEAGTPVTVAYPLAKPLTYQLTPNEVKTILGENNIFADTGDVSVEYRADIKKYIDKVVATAISALS